MEFEDVDEQMDWQARRVAAAFGVKDWTRKQYRSNQRDWVFAAERGEERITCAFWEESGQLKALDLARDLDSYTIYLLEENAPWRFIEEPLLHGEMARGLYEESL